jgi:hypothetical protein
MTNTIRFHCIHVDNEKDAQSVESVLHPLLDRRGIIAETRIYPFDGEWNVEFQTEGGRRNGFRDDLTQEIENSNIRWSGGGFSVNTNLKNSWRDE